MARRSDFGKGPETLLMTKHSFLIALLIALLGGWVAYWQSGRVIPIIDYSYFTEHSYRIYLGQIPWRDFGLVVMPGTYVVGAIVMKLFGVSHVAQVGYLVMLQAGTILLSYFILTQILSDKKLCLLFLLPLMFSGHGIYPHPAYDINTTFSMLVATNYLLWMVHQKKTGVFLLFGGILLSFPIFFKQNTGPVFALLFLSYFFVETIQKKTWKDFFWLTIGFGLLPSVFFFWIFKLDIWEHFRFLIFTLPGAIRPVGDSARTLLENYFLFDRLYLLYAMLLVCLPYLLEWKKFKRPNLMVWVWTSLCLVIIPWGLILQAKLTPPPSMDHQYFRYADFSFAIWYLISVIAGFVFIRSFFETPRPPLLHRMLLLVFVGTSQASFLAQGIQGSSYGIWPFFFFILALILRVSENSKPFIHWRRFFIPLSVLSMGIIAAFAYTGLRVRGYVRHYGKLETSTNERLKGFATPGPWVPQMDEMFDWVANHIPINELILTIPGEDPFYSTTGRTPPLPYIQINIYTLPMDAAWMVEEAVRRKVPWVVYKKPFQARLGYSNLDRLNQVLPKYYEIFEEIPGYTIYRINKSRM